MLYLLCNNQSIIMHIYQSLVVSLNWLTMCTCPNTTPIVTFLSAYNQHAITYHLKSPLYVLRYAHLTSDLGIHFSSASSSEAESHAQSHHRISHNRETYIYDSSPNHHITEWTHILLIRLLGILISGLKKDTGL